MTRHAVKLPLAAFRMQPVGLPPRGSLQPFTCSQLVYHHEVNNYYLKLPLAAFHMLQPVSLPPRLAISDEMELAT